MGQPDRQQHMGRIQGSGCARRAAGCADAFHVQHDEERLPFNELKTEIHIVREPLHAVSVEPAVRDLRLDPADQVISEPGFFLRALLHGRRRQFHCLPKPHDARYIFRARPALPLLCAAVDKGADLHPFSDIEESDPLRPVQFMPAGAEHVNIALVHINGDLRERLYRICVEQHAVLFCDLPDLCDRLHCTDLIIREHYRNQDRIRPDRTLHCLRIHEPVLVHVKISHLIPTLLEIFTCMQDRMVLDLCSNNMLSLCRISLSRGCQRPVIRLCAPCGKINLIRFRPEDSRDDLPLLCDHLFICRGKSIHTGRIPVMFRKIRQHCLYNFRRCLCRCRIVQINQFFHLCLLNFLFSVNCIAPFCPAVSV